MARTLVTGAGGFIGHHLIGRLVRDGHAVVGVDLKRPEFEPTYADQFVTGDLRDSTVQRVLVASGPYDVVYHLAADMGGIGYITHDHAAITRWNLATDLAVFELAACQARRLFYASTACVYPTHLQARPDAPALREEHAWPARPEEGYGLAKLVGEKLCEYYTTERGLSCVAARFHNIYGPLGTYDGGREKAPAALSRKIALAEDGGEIEIWGDGQQTRSFLYITDCVDGILQLTASGETVPLNIGSDRMVTIRELTEMISQAAGKQIRLRYVRGPQGVRGRNSDNTKCERVLGWRPQVQLEDGLATTYRWIASRLAGETR